MSKFRRGISNVIKGYSNTQTKVGEATSNSPWGPTAAQMGEIANLTYSSSEDFYEIFYLLDTRLQDGKHWRHVFKSLIVLDYLLYEGSELCVTWTLKNIYIIKTLRVFQCIEKDDRDIESEIRRIAKDMVLLVLDETVLQAARSGNKLVSRAKRMECIERAETRFQGPMEPRYSQTVVEEDANVDDEFQMALEASKKQFDEDLRKEQDGRMEKILLPSDFERDPRIGLSSSYNVNQGQELQVGNRNGRSIVQKVQAAAQKLEALKLKEKGHERGQNVDELAQTNSLKAEDRPQDSRRTAKEVATTLLGDNSMGTEPDSKTDSEHLLSEVKEQPQRTVLFSRSVRSQQSSDLVRDSKLETYFLNEEVQHISYVSNLRTRQRRVKKETRWRRRENLGAGAYGCVWLEECYEGEKDEVGAVRAVKEISRVIDGRPQLDYERELEAIAKFSHANYVHCFVQSFGWYESNNAIFITMEYVENGDLQKYLTMDFSEAEVREITSQLLEGLSYMHDNGFAHRDLKPGNILVSHPSPNWWVKISDFGISKRAEEEHTALRTMVGTRGYIAPEVIGIYSPDDTDEIDDINVSYTVAVDMWALGAIAFRLLTTQIPFSNPRSMFKYVTRISPFPDQQLADAGASTECRGFLARMMTPSPQRRPSAIEAMGHPWIEESILSSELQSSTSPSSHVSGTTKKAAESDLAPSAKWSTIGPQNNFNQFSVETGANHSSLEPSAAWSTSFTTK